MTTFAPSRAFHRLALFAALPALVPALLAVAPACADTPPLTLETAVRHALHRSAAHQAAESATQASAEAAVQAGQLPDPMLKLGIDNLPVEGPDRWSISRDFMTMRRIGIEQSWRTGNGADFARARGEDPSVTSLVAGIRFWF